MAKLFTKEELVELRRADAELDEEYSLTQEDIDFSRRMDREAKLDRLDNKGRRKAAQKAAYYEANKQKLLDYQRRYRQKKREAKKKAASDGANIESGSPI
jgi:hypothetical protein